MPSLKNVKHELFAQALAKGTTASEAYVEAGYKPSRAAASRMSAKVNIQERIREILVERSQTTEIDATVERVLKEFCRLAFYDPVAIIKVLGGKLTTLDKLEELPEDMRRCIHEITPTKIGDEMYYRVKFANKQAALESIARHLQMFKDTVIVENVFKVVTEMSDDELDRRLAELGGAFREATGFDLGPGAGKKTVH